MRFICWWQSLNGFNGSKKANTPYVGVKMVDFNPVFIVYLASGLRFLSEIRTGMTTQSCAAALIEARNGTAAFLAYQQHERLFPRTNQQMLLLVETINSLLPDFPAGTIVPNRAISHAEACELQLSLQRFITIFEEECRSSYMVGLEKQKFFDLHILVEAVESAFAARTWASFSQTTKREIDESAKCLALERYTSSGFHILRGLETEIKNFIVKLGAVAQKRDWGNYVQVLKSAGAHAKVTAVLDSIRTLHRNPLMRPDDWLNRDEAVDLFCICQTALRAIITDMEAKGLLP